MQERDMFERFESKRRSRIGVRRSVSSVFVAALIAVAASACGSSGPSVNVAAAPGQIASAYKAFFHLSGSTLADIEGSIQDGASLKSSIQQALVSPDSKLAAGATTSKVKVKTSGSCTAGVPSPCASLSYDIIGTSGSALLTGQQGFAVYSSSGKWLVAKTTVCNLFGLLYTAEGKTGVPPGC